RSATTATAILAYLARRHPEAGLLPGDPEKEARCFEWMNWLTTAVHAVTFGQIVRPQRFVADVKDFPAVIAKGRQNLGTAFAFIEGELRDKDWAVPGQYSIADAYLLFFYLGAKRAGVPMTERYTAWSRISERVLRRPAVQRALAQEEAQA
ncbi:MAG: glutathione S-transferase family protein, partial [Bradyrhizobium sp.]